MNQHHILIDIETLGRRPGSIVLSIGAVRFTWEEGIVDRYYQVIDPANAGSFNLTAEAETVAWWMQQDEAARAVFASGQDKVDVERALACLNRWSKGWHGIEFSTVYGNSPAFDLSILEEIYSRCYQNPFWTYQQERCVRTELEMYKRVGVNVPAVRRVVKDGVARGMVKHHALADAEYEAELLLACERERKQPGSVVVPGTIIKTEEAAKP